MEIRGIYEKIMFVSVLFVFLIIASILFLGCCHTGQVVFKGYSPPKLAYGYKPNRGGPGLQKSVVYRDGYNYVLIKKENGEYVRVKISSPDSVEVGDEITKYTLYYDTFSFHAVKAIEEYMERK